MGTFYVVATPIGNLEDITLRAVSVLNSVDMILAEDTRVTKKLLERYNIATPLKSYHQHSSLKKIEEITRLLKEGKRLALVCDAGTPGINDPGGFLIQRIVQALPDTRVVPIPGPNAAVAALSISGIPAEQFTYFGFPPQKKGRETFFKKVADIPGTVVFYESKYRIEKTLEQLSRALAARGQQRSVVVARELTKQFETVYRGSVEHILTQLRRDKVLGEFVVVLSPPIKMHPHDE